MTITVQYFIIDENGNFIDWQQKIGELQPVIGRTAKVFGGSGNDGVYVQPGSSADLTELGSGNDKVYLSGAFSQYIQQVDPISGVYTFTRSGVQ